MNFFNDAVEFTIDSSAGMLAVVALTSALVLGLATLARPSPATKAWGSAFGVGLLGTCLWVAADQSGGMLARAVGSAFVLCFVPLIWVGVRMFYARSVVWWPALLFLFGVPVALGVLARSSFYAFVFLLAFVVAGVFAVLIAVELFRSDRATRDIALPLALASSCFAVVAVVAVAAMAWLHFSIDVVPAEDQMAVLREINRVGILLHSVCAAFSVVLLVRSQSGGTERSVAAADRARQRLLKAERIGDPAWSLLDIRLDRPEDLRQASTGAVYAQLVEAFHEIVIDELPPIADADRLSDERIVVLIRQSKEAIQHMLRTLLSRALSTEENDATLPIPFSVSVGWAPVATVGYDYDVLLSHAADAAERASSKGGDCWERVDVEAS